MQAAWLLLSCEMYLGWLRKDKSLLPAVAKGANPLTTVSGDPCKLPPSCSTMNPSARDTTPSLAAVDDFDHLVGDVMLGADIHSFLKYDVVFFRFSNLLDHFVGFFQNLLQLFIFLAFKSS